MRIVHVSEFSNQYAKPLIIFARIYACIKLMSTNGIGCYFGIEVICSLFCELPDEPCVDWLGEDEQEELHSTR